MINQYVFIINFSSLYDLLDEIKENLSFKLIKCENENDFIQNSNLDKKNSLIISNSIPKLVLKKNLTEKNYLTLDFPLSLIKILELINIRLIKLRFNYQSKINIKGYVLDLNSKNF